MDMIGKIRRMSLRDKLSNSAIAKGTGLSRNTVKKWLKQPRSLAQREWITYTVVVAQPSNWAISLAELPKVARIRTHWILAGTRRGFGRA